MTNRVQQLREEKGMTQIRLSAELGITQETVSAYETEKHRPSLDVLIKMRELFDASIDYILGLSDIRSDTLRTSDLSKDEIRLFRNFRKMDAAQKEKVLAYIDGVIS